MFNLKNKNILITGASKGLGSVCAEVLAEHDTRLALLGRSKESLEAVLSKCKNSDKHVIIPGDLTVKEELHRSITRAVEFLGTVDVVLHVAGGGLGLREPLLSGDDFFKLISLNVLAIVEINKMIAPAMIASKKGNLVHVGSIASSEATGSVGYNSVKAALCGYVRSLGRELAGSGVVVTGILPGGFHAPENAMDRLQANKPEIYTKFVHDRLPRKKMGRAEEIIPLLLLLCSDSASMMGGCMVPIDAGEGVSYLSDQ